jgi:nucleotide-binding universal stress UspA family protein
VGQVCARYGIADAAGYQAIGHTRMATESAVTTEHSHPFAAAADLALVHNGSFLNYASIRRELAADGVRFDTDNDSEVSGYRWYSRETRDQASFVAEAATFELRMVGLAAGGSVRYAAVDRVAQAILAEANAFDAQLVVLGSPRRGEVLARLFGSATHRVIQRSRCPVLVASRRAARSRSSAAPASAPRG